MADSLIPVTGGSGYNVDTRTNVAGDHRQVIVLGDPSITDNVAAVLTQDVGGTDQTTPAIAVRLAGSATVQIAGASGSISTYISGTAGTINVQLKPGTLAVMLDPGHLLGSVTANVGTGTMAVYFDQSAPTVKATQSGTYAVYFDQSAPTVKAVPSTGTFTVGFDPGHELGSIKGINTSINVQFDPGHTLGKIDAGLGTFNVQLDPGHTIGNIATLGSITNTVAVFFSPANPAVNATFTSTSLEVVPTTGSRKTMDDAAAAQRVLIVGSQTNASLAISGTVTANAGTGTLTVKFDPGYTLGKVDAGAGTFQVFLPDTGHTIGKVDAGTGTFTVKLDPSSKIAGSDSSLSVYLSGTAGTIGVRVGQIDGTVAVYFSQSKPVVLSDNQNTASIFTVAGSTSGVSVSGVQLVAPSANASFKVFAFSLQTTGIVSVVARFTNGGGTATEFWRGLVTANQTSSTPIGANLAVQPPGYLFATGTSTTLALHLDTATLVHYSVSYIKESA